MISYRAETSMAALIMKGFGKFDGVRTLLQTIFTTDADLIPNTKNKSLIVRLHNLSTEGMNRKVDELFKYLNDAKIKYPGSNLILQYERVGK
jgi:glutathionylspermidine synthase